MGMKKMYSVDKIARYVVAYCNGNGYYISNLKLQKLLYFIQIKFLVEKKKLCFNEDIIAVDFGVVIPSVFDQYKKYGSSLIPAAGVFKRAYFPIADEDKDVIDEVISDVGNYSSEILLKGIIEHDVWKEAYQNGTSIVIPQENVDKYLTIRREKRPVVKARIYNFNEYLKK